MKIKLLPFFLLLFSFQAYALIISPPRAILNSEKRMAEITLKNNSEKPVAIYVEISRLGEARGFFLTSSIDEALIPPKSTETIRLMLLGEGDTSEETLFFVSLTELLEDVNDKDKNVTYISLTSKLKVIYTPDNLPDYKIKIKNDRVVNDGPKFMQVLSLFCIDGTEIKTIKLMKPFSEDKIDNICEFKSYKVSVHGRVQVFDF